MPLAIAALAALATLPAVRDPIIHDDDLVMREMLLPPGDRGPDHYGRVHLAVSSTDLGVALQRLYDWSGPEPAASPRAVMASGLFPWWTDEDLKVAFWRPLSALTHWADYRLWPDSASAIRLHNISWLAVAAAAVALLYRRIQLRPAGPGAAAAAVATFGAALWALDNRNWSAVAWVAARNITIAVAFGTLALLAHDAWRRGGSRAAAVLAPALCALALLAGEPGVATAAYLAAYAAFIDPARPRDRLLSLAPTLAVTVAWRVLLQAMGFGASENGLYLDPLNEPLRFAAAGAEVMPVLLLGQLGWPPADFYESVAPALRAPYVGACAAALAALLVFLCPLLRASATARFWGLGMVLAAVPPCAAAPISDRRLFFVGIGGMALIARWIVGVAAGAPWLPRHRAWRLAAAVLGTGLIAVHAVDPLLDAARRFGRPPATVGHPYLAVGDDPEIAGRELVLVTAPSPYQVIYLPFERAVTGLPMPARTRVLAPALRTLEIWRPADDSMIVRGIGGSLMKVEDQPPFASAHAVYRLRWTSSAFWHGLFPVPPGGRRRLPGMEAEVLEGDAGGLPVAVRFRFDSPLDERERRWLAWDWTERRYVDFTPPPIGGSVRLPRASGARPAAGDPLSAARLQGWVRPVPRARTAPPPERSGPPSAGSAASRSPGPPP